MSTTSITHPDAELAGRSKVRERPSDLPVTIPCQACLQERTYVRTDIDGDHIYYCSTCDWYSIAATTNKNAVLSTH